MDDDDELMISVGGREYFDIDFESYYGHKPQPHELNEYWHPCFKINEETVPGQDMIIGRDLDMYGQNDKYSLGNEDSTSISKILAVSHCHIGL